PRAVRSAALPRLDRRLRCRRLQDLIGPRDHPECPLVTAQVRVMLLRLRAERLVNLLHRGVRSHPQDRARIQRERMKAHKSTRFLPGNARRRGHVPQPSGTHGPQMSTPTSFVSYASLMPIALVLSVCPRVPLQDHRGAPILQDWLNNLVPGVTPLEAIREGLDTIHS